jgi:CDP-6-deoxy-D-xylo-4-hexulose-3-dehydrase
MKFNYNLAYSTWDNNEIEAIKSVIKKDHYTMSDYVTSFEKKFAKSLGRKYAIMTNSGSSANLLGVASMFYKKNNKLKQGDEVIVPGLSWSTTYSPLQQYGLKLKIVDIKLDSLNMDLDKFENAISKKTKLACIVSILGNPQDFNKIKKICESRKIPIFEDNCESLGASHEGIKAGKVGLFSTHSFFFSHHISTIEGGMIVTDDYELYCIMRSLRAHGWTRDLPKKNPLVNNKKGFYEEYKFILPGYNLRPTEINAAIGLVQLKKLPDMVKNRINNLQIFREMFLKDERFIIQKPFGINSSFCFPMVIRPNLKINKEKIYSLLTKAKIQFRLITGGSFLKHKVKKHFSFQVFKNLKNTDYIHDNGFFVGNTGKPLDKELNLLYTTLKKI